MNMPNLASRNQARRSWSAAVHASLKQRVAPRARSRLLCRIATACIVALECGLMKTSRRRFLAAAAAVTGAPLPAAAPDAPPDGFALARKHAIRRLLPTPNFFESMLLGNGDIGVSVIVRPDALGLHIGKEDAWDIRVSEDHWQHVLPFPELLDMWKRAGEEARRRGRPDMIFLESEIDFLREYTEKVTSSYRKPWPRPWPCGTVWIHWDARKLRIVRQTLDPSNGLYRLELEQDDLRGAHRRLSLYCFVHANAGHLCVWSDGPAPIASVAYYAHFSKEAPLPPPRLEAGSASGADFGWRQHFPARPDAQPSPKDREVALWAHVHGSFAVSTEDRRVFLQATRELQPLRLDLALYTTRDHPDPTAHARDEVRRRTTLDAGKLQGESETWWRTFWSRSAVALEDQDLERLWYHNQYWLACCLREGKISPGLFGNWSTGQIGTAWHGDYHMNYNTQQVFWGVFSSNHADQHLPYVDLVESLLPMAEAFAREKFGEPGAFFPHSAYPAPSQVVPYPAPPWGYEVCETPWVVQSLWWHYLYTLDRGLLKRVYPPLRAAARFLAAYVTLGGDGKYHIIPSVSPENWGFTVDFCLNRDCIMDLALTEFVLDAVIEASRLLDTDAGERETWTHLRANLAPYPVVQGPYGEVWTDVADGPAEHVYNVPVTLAPVFPGEQVGLGRGEERLELARRTARTVRLEGGNDVVYQPLIRARLGMLDLAWFKQEVRYCELPNGIVNDRVRQIDGRYRDSTDYDFMMRMGVWTENLSLPAVVNECLLQSYTGTLRLFPNTQNLGPARFAGLRSVGAFLVTAAWDGHAIVSPVTLFSEKGGPARLHKPWPKVRVLEGNNPVPVTSSGDIVEFETQPGRRYQILGQ